jgi:hypothetical protein
MSYVCTQTMNIFIYRCKWFWDPSYHLLWVVLRSFISFIVSGSEILHIIYCEWFWDPSYHLLWVVVRSFISFIVSGSEILHIIYWFMYRYVSIKKRIDISIYLHIFKYTHAYKNSISSHNWFLLTVSQSPWSFSYICTYICTYIYIYIYRHIYIRIHIHIYIHL